MTRRQGSPGSLATLAVIALTVGAAEAADEPTADSLEPCPYSQTEIRKELGIEVESGIASDMSGPGTREVGCVYPVKRSFLAFSVRQVWDPSGTSSPSSAPGGSVRAITGDADGAAWLGSQDKEHPHSRFHYRKGKVSTTVEVYGSYFKEEDMSPKLEKLRRLP